MVFILNKKQDLPKFVKVLIIRINAVHLRRKKFQAGLKGKGIAPILTHIHQALVLTNHAPQVATQADIERTMTLIQQTVYQQFGVMLEPEPVWIESDGRIRQTH